MGSGEEGRRGTHRDGGGAIKQRWHGGALAASLTVLYCTELCVVIYLTSAQGGGESRRRVVTVQCSCCCANISGSLTNKGRYETIPNGFGKHHL